MFIMISQFIILGVIIIVGAYLLGRWIDEKIWKVIHREQKGYKDWSPTQEEIDKDLHFDEF